MQDQAAISTPKRVPWNKGKLTGAKPPLRPKHVRLWKPRGVVPSGFFGAGRPVSLLGASARSRVEDPVKERR